MADPKRQFDRDGNSDARKRREAALDQALADTFPASDPVSIEQPAPPEITPRVKTGRDDDE